MWTDPIDGLRAGITLHRLEGIVRAEILSVNYDAASGRFEEELVYYDSYVAEQHVYHYGPADAPMCWSLAGYVSGYASACLGREIYFRETECAAQRAARCTLIGRDAPSWGDTRIAALRLSGRDARTRNGARSRGRAPRAAGARAA